MNQNIIIQSQTFNHTTAGCNCWTAPYWSMSIYVRKQKYVDHPLYKIINWLRDAISEKKFQVWMLFVIYLNMYLNGHFN